MGNQSSRTQLAPLAPQTRFPRVVNSRFVLEFATSLSLPLGFWSRSEPVEIVDADSRAPMFKVNPRASDAKKQLLLDKNGVPVVEMQGHPVMTDCATYVPHVPRPASLSVPAAAPQAWQEHRALCYLQTNLRLLEQRLLLELEDPVTRAKVNVRVEGSCHEALFWADRGVKALRECIARVYFEPHDRQALKATRKKKSGAADLEIAKLCYRVDIAPGVDVAMIVLACAALDEEMAKKDRGEHIEIGSDETTTLLAERHHGVKSRDPRRAVNGKAMFVMSDL